MARGQKPKFIPDKRPLTGKNSKEPPAWAVAVLVALFFGFFIVAEIAEWLGGDIRDWVPFGRTDFFWVGVIFMPMVALLVIAIAVKLFELRKASGWAQTTGRIVSSRIESRRHRFEGSAETVKNEPGIEYEFTANGRKVRGSRIGIGDDSGGENTEATLARYPAGANVTVFYDPSDPTSCVLERSGPQGITARGCIGALIELALFGAAIWWLVTRGPAFVAAHFPKAEQLSVYVFGFGLGALWFFVGYRRYLMRAQSWPFVRGIVVKSTVEEFRERTGDSNRTSYRPAVEYAYTVRGLEYHGNQIKLGLAVSGSASIAQKIAARYPEGSEVEVHYDPANPGNAALENPTETSWFPLGLAAVCFVFGTYLLGVFG